MPLLNLDKCGPAELPQVYDAIAEQCFMDARRDPKNVALTSSREIETFNTVSVITFRLEQLTVGNRRAIGYMVNQAEYRAVESLPDMAAAQLDEPVELDEEEVLLERDTTTYVFNPASLHLEENAFRSYLRGTLGNSEEMESLDVHDQPMVGGVVLSPFVELSQTRLHHEESGLTVVTGQLPPRIDGATQSVDPFEAFVRGFDSPEEQVLAHTQKVLGILCVFGTKIHTP